MFDKVFFKFALGFGLIIAVSIGSLYIADRFGGYGDAQTASVKK